MSQIETVTEAARKAASADRPTALIAGLCLAFGALFLFYAFDLRQAALYLIGGALGAVLYHAAFGFTGTWRSFILYRRAHELQPQLIMIAIATVGFSAAD